MAKTCFNFSITSSSDMFSPEDAKRAIRRSSTCSDIGVRLIEFFFFYLYPHRKKGVVPHPRRRLVCTAYPGKSSTTVVPPPVATTGDISNGPVGRTPGPGRHRNNVTHRGVRRVKYWTTWGRTARVPFTSTVNSKSHAWGQVGHHPPPRPTARVCPVGIPVATPVRPPHPSSSLPVRHSCAPGGSPGV